MNKKNLAIDFLVAYYKAAIAQKKSKIGKNCKKIKL